LVISTLPPQRASIIELKRNHQQVSVFLFNIFLLVPNKEDYVI